jgi:pimeloyl-ACP methyl ester carboxylesterase
MSRHDRDPADPDPPVLLLHGFATSARRTWRDNGWIDLLTDTGRTVVAPDLLGHGDAPKPHDPEAYDDLEDRVLDVLPEGPVDAIGFSLGARVILSLASEHPERFRRIVLAGVGANLFRNDDPELIARALSGEGGDDANPVAQYFKGLAASPEADPEALVAYLRRPHHRPLDDDRLAAIPCPVLVVLGDRDFAGPADPLLERLSNADLVTLPGVDHFATPKQFSFIDAALEFVGAAPG